ncbi:unnamed protein product [Clavelina lepadiformis]|uniref:Secreted protein n=1 Tax=Clavelina lepadiformis TaxID=159417 RepID=A0ABP0G587_CLALP
MQAERKPRSLSWFYVVFVSDLCRQELPTIGVAPRFPWGSLGLASAPSGGVAMGRPRTISTAARRKRFLIIMRLVVRASTEGIHSCFARSNTARALSYLRQETKGEETKWNDWHDDS